MMAATAEQDCGQCGYDCQNYAAAIKPTFIDARRLKA
jgi:hypothetical protein